MWLSRIFSTLLHMSFTASLVILAVCVLRLLLKRAPKVFSYALWIIVLFRLLCPVTFETSISVLPSRTLISTVQTEVISPQSTPSETATETQPKQTATPQTSSPATKQQAISLSTVAGVIWLAGVVAMTLYSLLSLIRLRRRLVGSVRFRDNLYLADHIPTPFVLGIIHPRIYLPSSLSEQEQRYILLHEQAHIRRGDHIVKVAGFFALSLHWFNPLVWLAFRLAVNDMELSCDEAVLRQMDPSLRADYSASLLSLATGRRIFPNTPLAFGEGNIKERIRNVMHYKKPTVAVLSVALVLCITATVCLATNPVLGVANFTDAIPFDSQLDQKTLEDAVAKAILDYQQTRFLSCECAGEGHYIMDYNVSGDTLTAYVLATYGQYQFVDDLFIAASGCGPIPTVITFQVNQDGSYTMLDYQEPEDGAMYEPSIKELFPLRLWNRCFDAEGNSTVHNVLRIQQDQYAEAYLSSIGREAEIGDYGDLNQPLLTDLGVSVEVSNRLDESKLLGNYPLGVGQQEQIEDGVRYVYRQDYDEQKQLISFTKSNYDTGEIVERFCFDATDGTLLQSLSFPKAEQE